MNFSRLTYLLLKAVLWIYVVIVLVDPLDQIFHLKSSLFLLILVIWMSRVVLGYTAFGQLRIWMVLIGTALIIPFIATLIGLLSGRIPSMGMKFSTIEIFLLLFLIPVMVGEKIDLTKILIIGCITVALITILICFVAFVSPSLYEGIYLFAAAKQVAYLSIDTDRFGIGIGSFYYKTSAMMVLPLSYYATKIVKPGSHRRVASIGVLIYFAALVFSGARANAIAALVIVGLMGMRMIRLAFGGVAAASASLLILSIAASIYLPRILNPTEESNAVKLGHWHSYVAEFEQSPSDLLWGEGADTEFYSSGFEQNTTITELTYMELIRNFGIPLTLFFLTILVWPIIRLANYNTRPEDYSYLIISYGAYLVMSASNPLLLSTAGMLLVVAVWSAVLRRQSNNIRCLGNPS